MKTFPTKLAFFIIFFLPFTCTYAGNTIKSDSSESKECLQVIGIAVDESNNPIDGVEIKLYKENEEVEWSEVTSVTYHDHSFEFKLEANRYYTIEISKPGFVKRSVSINTSIPSGVDFNPIFQFGFDVSLIEQKQEMENYYLDFPIALISYNRTEGVFESHKTYTKNIKEKIKREAEQEEVKKLMRTGN